MMGTTVVSFVYYFRILQQMFFRTGETEENTVTVKYKGCYESLCNFDCNTRDYADDWVQFLL